MVQCDSSVLLESDLFGNLCSQNVSYTYPLVACMPLSQEANKKKVAKHKGTNVRRDLSDDESDDIVFTVTLIAGVYGKWGYQFHRVLYRIKGMSKVHWSVVLSSVY